MGSDPAHARVTQGPVELARVEHGPDLLQGNRQNEAISTATARCAHLAGMRYALAAVIVVAAASSAQAMMPSLSDLPRDRTMLTCQQWAGSQDEEAIYMWGLLESGKTSEDVGRLRLALMCLGDRPPEIINFGSSVGAADQYCKHRLRAPICQNRR